MCGVFVCLCSPATVTNEDERLAPPPLPLVASTLQRFPLADAVLGRVVYLRHSPSRPGATLLTDSWRADDVQRQFMAQTHPMVVVDDFLKPDVLEEFRRFSMESTIWHEANPAGYVGAYSQWGLGSGLALQLAQEIRVRLPQLFANLELNVFWACVTSSCCSGCCFCSLRLCTRVTPVWMYRRPPPLLPHRTVTTTTPRRPASVHTRTARR